MIAQTSNVDHTGIVIQRFFVKYMSDDDMTEKMMRAQLKEILRNFESKVQSEQKSRMERLEKDSENLRTIKRILK